MYNSESIKIKNELLKVLTSLKGKTTITLGGVSIDVEGKSGMGDLLEEWFGVWANKNNFSVEKQTESQEFPYYFIGENRHNLEIKTFDSTAGANFDLANFDSYCKSVADNPSRADSDYLIFSYKLDNGFLSIENIWLKKIWEITCPSAAYPLKIQQKKKIIYNIRPANWDAKNTKFKTFASKEEFIEALFNTQKQYKGISNKPLYLSNL